MNLLTCMLTENRWYQSGQTIPMTGIVVHSSGANNPQLRRYVQPTKNTADYWQLLAKLGTNAYNNHWNRSDQDFGMHAFVGKLADGTVAAVQTLPWNSFLWGCGSGKNGSYNATHIQFEICEDTTDPDYAKTAYQAAVRLCADLCAEFSIDPGSIVGHYEAYQLGYGSNHGDPAHWWGPVGLHMDDLRQDVRALLADGGSEWSREARQWALETGILRGDGTSMAWKRPVTREELVTILHRMENRTL